MAASPVSAAAAVSAQDGAAQNAAPKTPQFDSFLDTVSLRFRSRRLEKFKTTIFTQMSSLAIKHGAINLGQGFPNFDGPEFVKEAAIQAIRDGKNQYARGYGIPDLNSAVAERFKKDTGLSVDPEKEITITSGCTEAIAATMLGLINPGDEVILFAPYYDCHGYSLHGGAKIKCVTLRKTFSLTGWKIGWAIAPAHLTWGLRQAHSYLTFATSTPMQFAAGTALRAPDSYYEELRRDYLVKKSILVEGLKSVGFKVYPSSGTYFVIVDHTPFGLENDVAFCEYLIKEVGVVAIPTSVFYLNPEDGKNLVRFTFCKDEGTLRSAVERMKEKLIKKG
ncbi:hypothetical protein DH2020_033946 [Rehmannia glutinosa]|uniref:Aminotransferase class I/classII large domain-containing protein n=1 Tax=Rehmannia glutinosa TaxID=99300 RepID=A0ABR0VBQ0_REHGL